MTHTGNMELAGEVLHVYASGDGALHFCWSGKEYPYPATGRRVKRWHVLRFLRTKEGQRLSKKGYKPYFINGFWNLVFRVVRKNENTLCVDRKRYIYAVAHKSPREKGQVWDCDLTVWTRPNNKLLRTIYGDKVEVKNWSTRAVILFFLNHEAELKRANKNGVINYPRN
jgi:hypothetical protein